MPKVTDALAEPYGRTISTMIPSLILEKADADPQWTQHRNGWQEIPAYPFGSYYEDSIDLSGYALQDMTFFPELGFLQESPVRSLTGFPPEDMSGILDATIISSVPLLPTDILTQLVFGSAPGMIQPNHINIQGTQDWSQILYCRIRNDVLNNTITGGYLQPLDQGQVGSLEPTAADKLYILRIVFPYARSATISTFTSLVAPAQRVGFRGMMAEEPLVEYMMRLKRSYELANQV